MAHYPVEILDPDEDEGTMPANVAELRDAVVGHRIVSVVEDASLRGESGYRDTGGAVITLDDGTRVSLVNTDDCCAFTEIREFLLYPELVDHVITGVSTTNGYTTWHIYADLGDVLELTVGWSAGNPFYYGYGFDIAVEPASVPSPL